MSWEAINATAQLISSFAVVASLWYLAIQVHRSTRVAKLASQDAAASALRDVTKQFSENAELGRIWRIGLEDINAPSPGLEHYWTLRHDLFSERFQRFVNQMTKPDEPMTVANLLGTEVKS